MTNGDGGSASSQFFVDWADLPEEQARAVAEGRLVLWLGRLDRGEVRGEYASAGHLVAVALPPGVHPSTLAPARGAEEDR